MPITSFQSEVLQAIARNRDPESFVAGGVPINRHGPRISADLDIFQDSMERVGAASEEDARALGAAGFTVTWLRRLPAIVSATIIRGDQATKLEWVADSDFRYFPAVPDAEFGYVLSMADLAVNKLMAAVGRREPRDIVDLLTINDLYLPLGAIVWAAVEAAPGFTPEGLLAELKRNACYTAADYRQLTASEPIDAADIARRLSSAVDAAERFVSTMPTEKVGRLFLRDGFPVQPDPSNLTNYVEHQPVRRGHWPTNQEVSEAMLQRHAAAFPQRPNPAGGR